MHTPVSTVVVVHAHPDDEAIFTGATIHQLARSGVRVVVVTATDGDAGIPQVPLRGGETIADRRRAELERACELLGVQRLVMLGYRDSGAHRGGPYPVGSLGAARVSEVTRRVADVAREEGAEAIIHYDRGGIYGHVDHIQVHRASRLAAEALGITGYEATVDGDQIRRNPMHVLRAAAATSDPLGVAPATISLSVNATPAALLAKMAAMTAHASQITVDYLDPARFAEVYGDEWFVRRGEPGPLERHLARPAVPAPASFTGMPALPTPTAAPALTAAGV